MRTLTITCLIFLSLSASGQDSLVNWCKIFPERFEVLGSTSRGHQLKHTYFTRPGAIPTQYVDTIRYAGTPMAWQITLFRTNDYHPSYDTVSGDSTTVVSHDLWVINIGGCPGQSRQMRLICTYKNIDQKEEITQLQIDHIGEVIPLNKKTF